jgi:hypothetical protein
MNPVDIYELFYDKEKHDLRCKKLKSLLNNAYHNNDQMAVDSISKFLNEAMDLKKRLDDFFDNYVKNN